MRFRETVWWFHVKDVITGWEHKREEASGIRFHDVLSIIAHGLIRYSVEVLVEAHHHHKVDDDARPRRRRDATACLSDSDEKPLNARQRRSRARAEK